MNDVNSPADSDKNAQTEAANNARRVTYYLIGAALLLWVYTLWADRFTPMTNHGRINGQLIRITPQVSGPIARITVLNNAEIRRGQPLLNIEQHPFQLEVSAAKLVLQQATLSVRSDSAAIEAAKANQVAARVKLINATQHAQRNKTLARRNVISKSTLDDSIAAQNSAQAVLSQATADLTKAEQALGPKGKNNPQIKSALNRLDQALLNLSYTELFAPASGVITNMTLATGDYATQGKPLLTYINNHHFWLTAMVRENSLVFVEKGTVVKIILDAYPGKIFHGEVSSIGWGSSGNGNLHIDASNGLFDSPNGLQHAQRFPVNIRFFDLPENVNLRYGGRATVSFYTGQSSLGENLLDVWTWFWNYLSYVS